jgi:hypothetical protein
MREERVKNAGLASVVLVSATLGKVQRANTLSQAAMVRFLSDIFGN